MTRILQSKDIIHKRTVGHNNIIIVSNSYTIDFLYFFGGNALTQYTLQGVVTQLPLWNRLRPRSK